MQGQVSSLLNQVKNLSDVQQRQIYAILGAIVADAASTNVHWVYDQGKLAELKKSSNLEFYPQGQCPFYVLPTGKNSIHGDVLFYNLKSLKSGNNVETATKFIAENITNDNSIYWVAHKKKEDKKYPIQGPWLMGAYADFKTNYEKKEQVTGATGTKDSDGFNASFASIVYGLKNELNTKSIEQYIRIVSNADISVQYGTLAATILFNIIQGKSLEEAVAIQDAEIQDVQSKKGSNIVETSKAWGIACPYPGVFKGSFLSMLDCSDYTEAVRANMLSGGESCARAFLAGACLGALHGVGGKGIPMEWIEKVENSTQTLELCLEIFGK